MEDVFGASEQANGWVRDEGDLLDFLDGVLLGSGSGCGFAAAVKLVNTST